MKGKTFILGVVCFAGGTAGSFATQLLTPTSGYSPVTAVPNQGEACVFRAAWCNTEGTEICTVAVWEAGITYPNVALKGLLNGSPTNCSVVLYKETE